MEDKIRENEAVKLIRFKDGYQKLSLAYMELSRKCGIIFEAQRDITTQLPDVLNRDLEDIKYTGIKPLRLISGSPLHGENRKTSLSGNLEISAIRIEKTHLPRIF